VRDKPGFQHKEELHLTGISKKKLKQEKCRENAHTRRENIR
jgi:hypothetical protein